MAKAKTAAKKEVKPAGKAKSASAKPLSKKALLHAVAEAVGGEVSLKHITLVLDTLATVAQGELTKTGVVVLPGFAKFVVVAKAAKPAHEGINPFTKAKQMFPAKPASKSVKARPVKAIKDAVRLTRFTHEAEPRLRRDTRIIVVVGVDEGLLVQRPAGFVVLRSSSRRGEAHAQLI